MAINLSKVIELDVSSSQPRRVWGIQEWDSALQDDLPMVIKGVSLGPSED